VVGGRSPSVVGVAGREEEPVPDHDLYDSGNDDVEDVTEEEISSSLPSTSFVSDGTRDQGGCVWRVWFCDVVKRPDSSSGIVASARVHADLDDGSISKREEWEDNILARGVVLSRVWRSSSRKVLRNG
jgi:hypothetical protein